MPKNLEYVVVNIDGQFRAGRRWVTEYPDAEFYTLAGAKKVANAAAGYAAVVRNYGYENEEVVYEAEGQPRKARELKDSASKTLYCIHGGEMYGQCFDTVEAARNEAARLAIATGRGMGIVEVKPKQNGILLETIFPPLRR